MYKTTIKKLLCLLTVMLLTIMCFCSCTTPKREETEPSVSVDEPATQDTNTKPSATTKPEKVTYITRPVSTTRKMNYNPDTDATYIFEGEAAVQIPGEWQDLGNCYISETYGTVNLIDRGEAVAVSNYQNEYSTEMNWEVAGHDITLSIATISSGITCYNFHISSSRSTYQFFYTTNANTTADAGAACIGKALDTFTITPAAEE